MRTLSLSPYIYCYYCYDIIFIGPIAMSGALEIPDGDPTKAVENRYRARSSVDDAVSQS